MKTRFGYHRRRQEKFRTPPPFGAARCTQTCSTLVGAVPSIRPMPSSHMVPSVAPVHTRLLGTREMADAGPEREESPGAKIRAYAWEGAEREHAAEAGAG